MKSKHLLWFIIGGLVARWGIDFGDMVLTWFTNQQTIYATRTQLKLNEMASEAKDGGLSAIGFTLPEEEYYYEED